MSLIEQDKKKYKNGIKLVCKCTELSTGRTHWPPSLHIYNWTETGQKGNFSWLFCQDLINIATYFSYVDILKIHIIIPFANEEYQTQS